MRFAGFVTLSARDGEELERAPSEIEHAGQLARLEFQRMYGEQEAAFTNTLPLCRGLRYSPSDRRIHRCSEHVLERRSYVPAMAKSSFPTASFSRVADDLSLDVCREGQGSDQTGR